MVMVKIAKFLVLKPKIKFCLQLPTYQHFFSLLNIFFLHFQNSCVFVFFLFFFLFCFCIVCVLLYQCLAEITKHYKLTRKPQDH